MAKNAEECAQHIVDYNKAEEIFYWLRTPPGGGIKRVMLLKDEWILTLADKIEAAPTDAARAELAVPCRQLLEERDPTAYYQPEEVEALERSKNDAGAGNPKALAVLCVSYCWETPEHPDPFGRTLVKIAKAIRNLKTWSQYGDDAARKKFAVFLDWTALPQKVNGQERNAEDKAAFDEALSCMQVWYAHMLTTVLLLTGKQEGVSLSYQDRGWPTFERLVSMILTPKTSYVWPMIVDVGAMPDGAEEMPDDGYCKRLVPMSVDRFAATIREKKFTNNADVEVVIGLYKKTVESVLGKAPTLKMNHNNHWGDAEMRELVEVLPLCAELTELAAINSFHEVTAEGVGVLTRCVDEGKLPPKLKEINWFAGPSVVQDDNADCTKELRAACERRGIRRGYF